MCKVFIEEKYKHSLRREAHGISKKRFHILNPQIVLEFWFMVSVKYKALALKKSKNCCVGSTETRVDDTAFCVAYTVSRFALTVKPSAIDFYQLN